MTKSTSSYEAVEDAAQAVLNNTNQALDLLMNRSSEMMSLHAIATRSLLERQAEHLQACQQAVGSQDELVKLQENYAKNESQAAQDYAMKVYALANSAYSGLSSLSDNNRNLSGDFIADSLEQAADAAQGAAAEPFGNLVQTMLRNQARAFQSYGEVVDKAVTTQRDNISQLRQSMEEIAVKASSAGKKKK